MSLAAAPLLANTIPAVISAGAQIYGNIRSNNMNQQAGAQQRQHELDMWHMANAYNSPAAQMQRLREAGLNPHLVHGNADQADVPRQTPDEPTHNPFDSILPTLQLIQQVRATNSEIAKTQAEIAFIQGNTANQDIVRKDLELRQNITQFDQFLKQRQHELEQNKFSHTKDMSVYQRDLQIAQTKQALARGELFLEQASTSKALTPVQIAQIRQNMRFQADLHQYNLESTKARATIDQFHSSDRMLKLLEEEIMNRILKTVADTEKAQQRKILGIDVDKDNIFRFLFTKTKNIMFR